MADPNGQEAVALDRLEEHDRLLAHEVEADPVDVHLLHQAVFSIVAPILAPASRPESLLPRPARVSPPWEGALTPRWTVFGSKTSSHSRESRRTKVHGPCFC